MRRYISPDIDGSIGVLTVGVLAGSVRDCILGVLAACYWTESGFANRAISGTHNTPIRLYITRQ